MLDLPRLERIKLRARPLGQKVMALGVLVPNYELPPRVKITIEGAERVPPGPVIFAMNHTDRYNYWPFQYVWWRKHDRFTATWVKGKYYENKAVGKFMELTSNIPAVSRGYLITRDFLNVTGRRPKDTEYEALRAAVNAASRNETAVQLSGVPDSIQNRARDMLGRRFNPSVESYSMAVDQLYRRMMRRFVELNREAAQIGLDLLIFPEGTRSLRLSRGRIGIAQMAMHLKIPVVPVGCNGSSRVYPGSLPIGRPGRIVYRIGEPFSAHEMASISPSKAFEPFTPEAETRHGPLFQEFVDRIIERIDGLLDPEHRMDSGASEGVSGSNRFL